jgi:FkbM family methyltransferase
MISYAQNFEDVMLNRVFKDRKEGFYIDVGAMDPVIDSVTKHFYDQGWSGINIEPNDLFYRKLLEQRPRDINLRLALGERQETRQLHVFENTGNSTFEDATRDRYMELGFLAKDRLVGVTTLASICRDFVRQEIDFLKIDCEGWEEAVIRGADWDHFRPIVVIVEATAPGTTIPTWGAWDDCLRDNAHYEMVYFDGLNRFYIRSEYSHLRSHFSTPPNVFDEFTTYSRYAAEREVEVLRTQRDEMVSRIAELEGKLRAEIEAKEAVSQRLAHCDTQIAELEKQCQFLERTLLNTRLWVGRLSQELAANRLKS